MIKLIDVEKGYKGKVVFQKLNLEIKQGEMIAIMGQSGIGKTTLLNILGFLDDFDQGQYLLNGKEVSKLSEKEKSSFRRTTINYILQNYGLVNSYSVYENMEIPLEVRKVKSKLRKEQIERSLEKLQINDLLHEQVTNISGGEKQRVAIARCLLNDVDIILADEPTGNLDKRNSDNVMEILREINLEQGKTIVIVTHSDEIASKCDKVYTIKDGQIKICA